MKHLAEKTNSRQLHPLVIEHEIDPFLFKRLQLAAATYISMCLPGNESIIEDEELISRLVEEHDSIHNITPNGMIVAKRHLILQYNAVVQAFTNIVKSMNSGEDISSWHIPLNLRFKAGIASESNLNRHHPTEHIHSDSWAGESAESMTAMIPIFGDIQRNFVKFYAPPQDFEESWLGALPSYIEGKEIADKYEELALRQKKGCLYMADFSSLHASSRLPGAGGRVSIDTTFVMKGFFSGSGSKEVIHHWREDERMKHEDLMTIGEKTFFIFPDSNKQHASSEEGFKHPTNLSVLQCKDLFKE